MTIAQRISAMIGPMPEDSSVTLSVRSLREMLADEQPLSVPDMTLETLRLLYFPDVSVTALREWCQLRKFPHSYKRRGRVWMVPVHCVEEFKEAERAPKPEPERPVRKSRARKRAASSPRSNLSAWRDQ